MRRGAARPLKAPQPAPWGPSPSGSYPEDGASAATPQAAVRTWRGNGVGGAQDAGHRTSPRLRGTLWDTGRDGAPVCRSSRCWPCAEYRRVCFQGRTDEPTPTRADEGARAPCPHQGAEGPSARSAVTEAVATSLPLKGASRWGSVGAQRHAGTPWCGTQRGSVQATGTRVTVH